MFIAKSDTFKRMRLSRLAPKQKAVEIAEPMQNKIVISAPSITPIAQMV